METKGIIISQKDYERLTDIEKNFNDKVKENKEWFKKGLVEAIKGDLVKILWINDPHYAELMGCDLSDEGIFKFISRADADFIDKVSQNESYNKDKLVSTRKDNKNPLELINECEHAYKEQIIATLKKSIRNLWWAFGIMFVAWLVQIILYIAK